MEKTIKEHEKRDQYQELAKDLFPVLSTLKKEGNSAEFNKQLLKIIPPLHQYIERRLRTALTKKLLPQGKYQAEYYLDELIIHINDDFESIKGPNDFYPWLFHKADLLLEATIEKEVYDASILDNLENYSKLEWGALQEKFSREADGDLVFLEELDDISYRNYERSMTSYFFGEDQQLLIRRLDEEWGKDQIDRHLDIVLYHMPLEIQVVFDLLVFHHFSLEEIARIRNYSIEKVEQLLSKAQDVMGKSLYQRYTNTK